MAASSNSFSERSLGKFAANALNPVTSTLKRAYEQKAIRPTIARAGILPGRARPCMYKPPPAIQSFTEDFNSLDQSTRTDELICRFFLSNGLSYETAEDPGFLSLMQLINPNIVIPTFPVIEACVERMAYPIKPHINYQKTVGPLTATIDLYRHNDEVFLGFSIHYFEDSSTRKNAIYLRKMILCEIDGENIMTCVRRAINNFNYGNVKFTNIVAPDEIVAQKLYQTDAVTNSYTCFFTYLTRFVEDIVKVEDFHKGLSTLRTFVLFLRRHSDLYSKFRRLQLTKNGDLDLPCLDNSKWTSTIGFLTKCLLLHDTFVEFAARWHLTTYITDDMYAKLTYLQRLLSYLQKFSKELSTPESSISQIVPTVVSIKCFIDNKSTGFSFEKSVHDIFGKHLLPLISGFEDRKYDFACLLDPRYGYRESIYDAHTWRDIENSLKSVFANEEMMVSDKNPCEMILLSTPAKFIRLAKVEDELKLYRSTIAAGRPISTTSPFIWWANRMKEMNNLFNKSRECLAPPAVVIDTEHYFGRSGKFSHLCTKLNYQQLENALIVAAQHESFRGRGFANDSTASKSKNEYSAKKSFELSVMENRSQSQRILPPVNGSSQLQNQRQRASGNDDFLENMLMIPPPQKRNRPESSDGINDDETEIKKEVEDIDGTVKIETERSDKIKEIEVKQEILEDTDIEIKPEPFLNMKDGEVKAKNLMAVHKLGDHDPSTSKLGTKAPTIIRRYPVSSQSNSPPTWIPLRKRNPNAISSKPLPPPFQTVLPPSAAQPKKSGSYVPESVELMEMLKKRQCNRRCSICLQVEEHDNLKNVTITNEKMIILTGMVTDGKMSLDEARYCYSKSTKTYICRRHFDEACNQIFNALDVTTPDEVFSAKQEKIKSILETIEEIKGTPMGALQFKQIFITFSEKYSKYDEDSIHDDMSFDNLFSSNSDSSSAAVDSQGSSKSDNILPKALRQPRKQVLEKDNEELVVRRIIQYKPWQTKRASNEKESAQHFKNPFRCCFCQNLCERTEMVKVPNSEERRQRWYEKLGKEFEEKVKSVEDTFICRAHFQDNAFSSRGRLRKGMLPCTPEEIMTFKLKGDNFEPIDNETLEDTSDEDDEMQHMSTNDRLAAALNLNP